MEKSRFRTRAMEELIFAKENGLSAIIVARHGKKTKDGQHITKEEIENIMETGFNKKVDPTLIDVIMLGTDFERTHEVARAFAIYVMKNNGNAILGKRVSMFGNKKMFSELFPNGKNYPELTNLDEAKLSPHYKDHACRAAAQLEILLDGEDPQTFLVTAHTPTVEMLADHFGYEVKGNTAELDGFLFVKEETGIKVYPL